MILKHVENWLSISEFDEIELPALTILTGLNGSGKTHLLRSIKWGKTLLDEINTEDIVGFDYNSFIVNNDRNTSHSEIERKRENTYDNVQKIVQNTKNANKAIIDK